MMAQTITEITATINTIIKNVTAKIIYLSPFLYWIALMPIRLPISTEIAVIV